MKYTVICTISLLFYASCGNLFYHDVEPAEPVPRVDFIDPADGKEDVLQNYSLYVYFTSIMDHATVTGKTIIVEKIEESSSTVSRQQVTGDVSAMYNNGKTIARFSLPSGSYFEANTKYQLTVKSSIKGRTGKRMERDVVSVFYTGSDIDEDPPEIVLVAPEYLVNANNYLRSFDIQICFNEPLDTGFIRDAVFIIRDLDSGPAYVEHVFRNDYLDDRPINDNIIGYVYRSNMVVLYVELDLVPPGNYEFEMITPTPITDKARNAFIDTATGEIKHLFSYRTPCIIPGQDLDCCYR